MTLTTDTSRTRRAWRTWPVWGQEQDGNVVYAPTASKARYRAYLDWSDVCDLRIPDIRVIRDRDRDIILPAEHRLVRDLTEDQRRIISHAYRCDRGGKSQRNHYCTHPGDIDILRLIWEYGLFRGPYGEGAYGDTGIWCGAFFYLTELGVTVARSMLPTYAD